jgi:hypothetical protein
MATYSTEIESVKSQSEAFSFMADFRNAETWDANTSSVKLIEGDPLTVGARYEVVTGFGGRDLTLIYETVEIEEPRKVVLESATGFAKIRDTITIVTDPKGSRVGYEAQIITSGLGKLLDPIFGLIFKRVGGKAESSLRDALSQP